MAKLSEETFQEGRAFIIAKDLDGLRRWLYTHQLPVLHDVLIEKMDGMLKRVAHDLALKCFDSVFKEMDVDKVRKENRSAAIIVGGIFSLVLLAITGGICFLVWLCSHG